MSNIVFRTRFKKEIVAEFAKPAQKSNKVMIFCDGMPSAPKKRELMEFFVKKGYWVFHPRYRGSWESDGEFLKISPHQDILDIIDQLPKGFREIGSKLNYKIASSKIHLLAGSFGGPAGLIAGLDNRIHKVVAIAPVVDWQAKSRAEPLDWLYYFVKDGFGNGYRFPKSNWQKLKKGKFYNPVLHIKEFDREKIFIIHAKDDESVSWSSVNKFVKKVGCQYHYFKKGGHISSSVVMKPSLYKKISKFLTN